MTFFLRPRRLHGAPESPPQAPLSEIRRAERPSPLTKWPQIRLHARHGRDIEDPEVAVAWADEISNQEMRSEQVERSARSWLANDRAAALEYLEQSNSLSAEQKTELINLSPEELNRGGDRDGRRGRGRPF